MKVQKLPEQGHDENQYSCGVQSLHDTTANIVGRIAWPTYPEMKGVGEEGERGEGGGGRRRRRRGEGERGGGGGGGGEGGGREGGGGAEK